MYADVFKGCKGPQPNPETADYWAAYRDGAFVLPVCNACSRSHWYPRAFCPFCHSEATPKAASGFGTIHTYAVVGEGEKRYCLAYVQLKEGPLMLTNLLVHSEDSLKIGAEVHVDLMACENGEKLPVFRLVAEQLAKTEA